MRKRTVYTEDFGGHDYEIDFEPVSDVLKARVGDKVVISYLAYDDSSRDIDDLMGEGCGELISFHRDNQRNHGRGFRELEENPDAVSLDCYSHSGEHWSLSGQGMQCQWDTARGAGVFVPSEDMSEELAKLEPNERRHKAREWAQSFLDTYNNIIGGQVFGCVTQVFDEDGDEADSDSCWGFIGSDYAEQALKEEFFDPMCSSVAKKYEEEIRTQCDRQLELEL